MICDICDYAQVINNLIKINDTNTNSDEQQGRLRRLRSIGP
jgi:hypothetical protein